MIRKHKSNYKILSLFIVFMLLFVLVPSQVFASEEPVEKNIVIAFPQDFADNEELFAGYVNQLFYGETAATWGALAREQLDENEQLLYDALKTEIEQIAYGAIPSTVISVDDTVSANFVQETFGNSLYDVLSALLSDCPYEMYWYDKTEGLRLSYFIDADTIVNLTIEFAVAPDYQTADYDAMNPEVDIDKTGIAWDAYVNATALVQTYSNMDDYNKLKAYCDLICDLTEYNDDAISDSYTDSYGDPWQLIYVFDYDPDTKVVCEGYAKAFQYLCDMSTFDNDIYCMNVWGTMTVGSGSGNHMWNIVSINEENYLVDITNCEDGTIGKDYGLFLVGGTGDPSNGYTIDIDNESVLFEYDSDVIQLWGTDTDSILTLSEENYQIPLDIPLSLEWNMDINGNTQYGVVRWGTVENCDKYQITLYTEDNKKVKSFGTYGFDESDFYMTEYLDDFIKETGGYYFTVQALGNESYSDSEIAVSDVWQYTKPETKLAAPENLKWNVNEYGEAETGVISFNTVEDCEIGYRYYIYKDNEILRGVHSYIAQTETGIYSADITRFLDGPGEYYFTVQALGFYHNLSSEIATSDVYVLGELPALNAPYDIVLNMGPYGDNTLGYVYWKIDNNPACDYMIEVYKDGELFAQVTETCEWEDAQHYWADLYNYMHEEGTYYVKVRALGDGVTCSDSEAAISETFRYTEPTEQLPSPLNLKWHVNADGDTEIGEASWSFPSGYEEEIACSYVQLYRENGEYMGGGVCYSGITSSNLLHYLDEPGSYYFTVTLSGGDMHYWDSEPAVSEVWVYEKPEALPAPQNLKWNINGGDVFGDLTDWDFSPNSVASRVTLYKDGEKISQYTWWDGTGYEYDPFWDDIVESGSYYFTVQAIGDGVAYSDSEIAKSPVWEYVKPNVYLDAPQNLKFNVNEYGETEGAAVSWDAIPGYVGMYFVELYTEDGNLITSYRHDGTGADRLCDRNLMQDIDESGYYYFTVCAAGDKISYLESPAAKSEIQYIEVLDRLDTPENLRWNENKEGKYEYGAIMWDEVENAVSYTVNIYTADGDNHGTRTTTNNYIDGKSMMVHFDEETEYYFLVRAIGDNVNYWPSYINGSDYWEYVKKPMLADPENLKWNVNADGDAENGVISWEQVEYASRYQVHIYEGNGQHLGGIYTSENELDLSVYEISLEESKSYYFTVTALGDQVNFLDSNTVRSVVYLQTGTQQLSAPTNLKWNVNYAGETEYGYICFDSVANCEGDYQITIYKNGEEYKLPNGTTSRMGYSDLYGETHCLNFKDFIFESGTYTFSVKARGDGVNYTDSELAYSSDSFIYTRPAAELGIPAELKWVGTNRYWKPVKGAAYYWIHYYKDGNMLGASSEYPDELTVDGDWVYTTDDWLFDLINRAENGEGKYSFSVQAYSEDITKTANGDISEMSPVTDIGEVAHNVNTALKDLNAAVDSGVMSAKDARTDLLNEAPDKLAVALAAKEEVVQNMDSLETSYKAEQSITVQVNVSNEAQDNGVADASKIEITGAALNTSVSGDEVSFNISKSKTDYPIQNPLQYKNTVFMDMNLTGDGINQDGSLSVPVYIKMPVPENIDVPERFRILHYLNSTGDYEVIVPAIERIGETYYASFILTHFSPFAFTEAVTQEELEDSAGSYLKGDVNLDGSVNMDDVVALLNHVVKAEIITDSTALLAGEVTNDTDLNMDDVVKLLNYVVKAIDSLD